MSKMVLHMSRDQAITFDPTTLEGDWAMLSICEPNQPMPRFKHAFKDILTVQFLDREDPRDAKSPNLSQATLIQKKLDEWVSDGLNIAVHCFAGVSRSAAVAKHLEQYSPEARMKKYPNANKLLLKLLNEAEYVKHTEAFKLKRTQYLGYAFPYDLNKRKRVCLDCGGTGCDYCEDGFIESVIVY